MRLRHCLLLTTLFWATALLAQRETFHVYLKDGGFLHAVSVDTLGSENLLVELPSGKFLHMPLGEIVRIVPQEGQYYYLPGGAQIKVRGFFTRIDVSSMAGHSAGNEEPRTGYGIYAVRGYRWSPWLATGVSLGYEAQEYGFLPLEAELSGMLSKVFKGNAHSKAFVMPLYWKLRTGFFLPARRFVQGMDENGERVYGSWIIHPSLGLFIPTRSSVGAHLELGYRFQRYLRQFESPQGVWKRTDRIILKSLSFRLGVEF
ncbi:MAG: hypothetical protein KatS3mg029_0532 [Saprospiraceae bacterium]|nr:MAG: hypothetical protein KatS3mg029_0532 [Saprospiraceae bacterium]